MDYALQGWFVEACNCTVICPCWVDDTPDEDSCAGLFAWKFDSGSVLAGQDVSGRSVVSLTVHGSRRRPPEDAQNGDTAAGREIDQGGESQSAIFVDAAVDDTTFRNLVAVFSGRDDGVLADLSQVTGEVVLATRATITLTDDSDGWTVRVTADGNQYVRAQGSPAHFDGGTRPLQLTHTALAKELALGDAPVTASQTSSLLVDVLALPGTPVDVVERSAMTGRFAYRNARTRPEPAPVPDAELELVARPGHGDR